MRSARSPVMSLPSRMTRPGVRLEQARDAIEECRLSGAVGADDPVDAAPGDLDVDLVQGQDCSEGLAQALDLEHAAHP